MKLLAWVTVGLLVAAGALFTVGVNWVEYGNTLLNVATICLLGGAVTGVLICAGFLANTMTAAHRMDRMRDEAIEDHYAQVEATKQREEEIHRNAAELKAYRMKSQTPEPDPEKLGEGRGELDTPQVVPRALAAPTHTGYQWNSVLDQSAVYCWSSIALLVMFLFTPQYAMRPYQLERVSPLNGFQALELVFASVPVSVGDFMACIGIGALPVLLGLGVLFAFRGEVLYFFRTYLGAFGAMILIFTGLKPTSTVFGVGNLLKEMGNKPVNASCFSFGFYFLAALVLSTLFVAFLRVTVHREIARLGNAQAVSGI